MSETIKPIIEYGFYQMDLNRMEACIGSENNASLSLVRRMNFTQEGHLREHFCKNRLLGDSLVFVLLRSEYEKVT